MPYLHAINIPALRPPGQDLARSSPPAARGQEPVFLDSGAGILPVKHGLEAPATAQEHARNMRASGGVRG